MLDASGTRLRHSELRRRTAARRIVARRIAQLASSDRAVPRDAVAANALMRASRAATNEQHLVSVQRL